MSKHHLMVRFLVLIMVQCVSSSEIHASFNDKSDERTQTSQLQFNLIESYYQDDAPPAKPVVFTPPVIPGRFAFFTSWFKPRCVTEQELEKLTESTFLILTPHSDSPASELSLSKPVVETKDDIRDFKLPVHDVFSLKECALLSVHLPPNLNEAERAEIFESYRSYKTQFRNRQNVSSGLSHLVQGFSWKAINAAKLAFAESQIKGQGTLEPNKVIQYILDETSNSKFASRSERRKAQLLSVRHYIDYQWDKQSYDRVWQQLACVKSCVMPDEDLVWMLLFEVSLLREQSPFPVFQILPRMRQLSKFLPNNEAKGSKYVFKMTKEQEAWFWLWAVELFIKDADSAVETEHVAATRLYLISQYLNGYRSNLAMLYYTWLHIRYKFESSSDAEIYNYLEGLETLNSIKFKTHYLPVVRLLKADMHVNKRAKVLSDAEVHGMLGTLRDTALFQDQRDCDYAKLLFMTLQVDRRIRAFSGDRLFDALEALMHSSLSFYDKLKLPLFLLRLVAEKRTKKLDLPTASVLADEIRNDYASNRDMRFSAIAAKAKIIAAHFGFKDDLGGDIKVITPVQIEIQLKQLERLLPSQHLEKIALQLCRCRLYLDRFDSGINYAEVYQILSGVMSNPNATPEHRTEAIILTLEQRSSS